MQEDRNWSATIHGTSHFDDEITLPLRIICERKSEAAGTNPREEQKTHKDVREREHRLIRAS